MTETKRFLPKRVRGPFYLFSVLAITAGGLSSGRADSPAEVPEPEQTGIDLLLDSIVELIDVLDEHGLHFDPEAVRRQTLESLIRAADPHGRFIAASEIQAIDERQRGLSYDLGIRIRPAEGGFEIVHICPDGPAVETGLEAGGLIVGINHAETEHMGLHRFLRIARKDTDEPAHLVVRGADGATNDVTLSRRLVRLPAMETADELPRNLAYLRINALLEESGKEAVRRLLQWRDEERYGVVLDLRGAGGDNLEAAARIASLFAEAGSMLFAYRDRDDQDELIRTADRPDPIGMPTMVLVDDRTSGAAEVLAAALKSSGRGAMLFGQTTKGDFLIRDVRALSTGERIYVTHRRLVLADGTTYDGQQGVRPDVEISRDARVPATPRRDRQPGDSPETIEHDRLIAWIRDDAVLRRSIDVLLGLKALNIHPLGSSIHSAD